MPETRYLVFAGDNYPPSGGAGDFVSVHDDQTAAALAMPLHTDWAHVAELSADRLVIVAEREATIMRFYPERMSAASRPQDAPTGEG